MKFLQYSKLYQHRFFLIILAVYIVFNLLTLTQFPRPYEDEGILAQFSKLLFDHGLPIIHPYNSNTGTLENTVFFPLSGGLLYYGSNVLFGAAFDFSLYSMRLQPLFFSIVVLILVYKLALLLFGHKQKAYLAVLLTAFATQFIILAHTVRQEMMFVAALLLMLFLFLKGLENQKKNYFYTSSLIAGLSISIHPNGIFLPLFLLTLYFYFKKQHKLQKRLAFQSALFVILGGIFYFVCDFLPYLKHYWALFHSPFFEGHTNHLHLLLTQPLETLNIHFYKMFHYVYLNGRDYRYTPYLIFNIISVVGGMAFIKSKGHRLILFVLFLLFILHLLVHYSIHYLIYFIPFFALLFSSVYFEIKEKIKGKKMAGSFSLVSVLFLILYLAHPAVTVFAFRNYDYKTHLEPIIKMLPANEKTLASSTLFFYYPDSPHYQHYVTNQKTDLKKLFSQYQINYVILDKPLKFSLKLDDLTNPHTQKNLQFLEQKCHKLTELKEYKVSLKSPSYRGEPIILYNCAPNNYDPK